MYNVGTILRKTRESKGLSVEEIANQLHIKPEYIEAIEKNDFSIFKSPAYVKGVVRNYCNLLGVDYEKILPFLRRQLSSEVKAIPNKLTPIQIRTVQIGYIHFLLGILLILLGVGIFFIARAYLRSIKPPYLELLEPQSTELTTDRPTIRIKGVTEERTVVRINGEEVPLSGDFVFEQEVTLEEGENVIVIEAEKTYVQNKVTRKELRVIYEPPVADQGEQSAPESTAQVTVKVTGEPAWLLIRADKSQVDIGIKRSGYEKIFNPVDAFEVITGKPSATEVIFNGKTLSWKVTPQKIYVRCERTNNTWNCEQ